MLVYDSHSERVARISLNAQMDVGAERALIFFCAFCCAWISITPSLQKGQLGILIVSF
jgi:hypothetical protein